MSISSDANEFVRHVGYELNRREHTTCNALTPGKRNWDDALDPILKGLEISPVKQAKNIERAITTLNAMPEKDCAFYIANALTGKRRAALDLVRVTLSDHPLVTMKEQEYGMLMHLDMLRCSRARGKNVTLVGLEIAYVSNHALGRLFERGMYDTYGKAINIGIYCGLLGLAVRTSEKHTRAEMNLRLNDVILTGVLIHPRKYITGGKEFVDGTYIDFRTCLPYSESHPKRREQADRSAEVVNKMLEKNVDGETWDTLASSIPYIPRREDSYVFSHFKPAA